MLAIKHSVILFTLLISPSCGTYCRINENDSLVVLTDTQFMVEDSISGMEEAISHLGPNMDMVINVSFCPGVKTQTTEKVLSAISAAGFDGVSIATDSEQLRWSCTPASQSK